jgi:hypothetical protein
MESRRPRVANWRVWVLEMLGTERKWRDAMRLGLGNITWHQFHGLRDKRIATGRAWGGGGWSSTSEQVRFDRLWKSQNSAGQNSGDGLMWKYVCYRR